MRADAEATLPSLIEACKRLITEDRRRAMQDRGAKIAEAHRKQRVQAIEQGQQGWDASPVSLNRLCAELWPLIQKEDWSLVSWQGFISGWPGRLWNFEKPYQYIGGQGGGGIGYNAPASVGAALANKKYGRLSINIQCDGDLNYAPGVLWTAAHHKLPLNVVIANNGGYRIIKQRLLAFHGDDHYVGMDFVDPPVDFSGLARSLGLETIRIGDPKELKPKLSDAFKRPGAKLIEVMVDGSV